jgi:SMI1/KNR4 family protein SUKH-1
MTVNPLSVDQTIDSLLKKWAADGVTIGRPNSLQKIQDFEKSHKVQIPADLRHYLLAANGTGDSDSNGYWFWPLEKIRSALNEIKTHNYASKIELNPSLARFFIFADYLQWCWAFAFRFAHEETPTSEVFRVDGHHLVLKVADSFVEFAALYLADSPRLYEPDRTNYL